MNTAEINADLEELELLIKLQSRKLDLIEKKSNLLRFRDSISPDHSLFEPIEVGDRLETIPEDDVLDDSDSPPFTPMSPSESVITTGSEEASKNIQSEQHKSTNGDSKTADIETPDRLDNNTSTKTLQNIVSSSLFFANQTNMVNSLERLNRLSNDLANERTLLAMGRTAMALSRNSIACVVLAGASAMDRSMVQTVSIGFAVLALWLGAYSIHRFHSIKQILRLLEPPSAFDRLENKQVLVILLCIVGVFIVALIPWDYAKY